ncbi:phospho-N-acetylmuramoyl-pentapeptide-transferase [bacterium]|jgi:phospho-N-acetylmuramoyl-pentapeptide-transferase|nr:phospho-N-acetylmuramoyl-pentapeptide-transferase [bacterium]
MGLATIVVGSLLIQYGLYRLIKRTKAYQPIYDLSPSAHQSKQGTPTMGGLGIIISIGFGFWVAGLWQVEVLWLYGLLFGFGLIGSWDDYLALRSQKNKGFGVREKFVLEVFVGGGALLVFHALLTPLTIGTFLFYLFVLVGSANATNLTDGLDGLLGGLSLITLAGFLGLFWRAELDLGIELVMVVGISIAVFLLFNRYPAKLFMGDTGSLALGALFAGMAILVGNVWILLPFGAIYILETLSVIIQVAWFKRTGKRVFLMAPLHHHFELLGLKEWQVTLVMWGLAIGFVMVGW